MVTDSKTEARTPELDKLRDATSDAVDSTPDLSSLNFDPDAVQKKAKEFASDVSTRPGFYVKILGYVGGGFIGLTILNAVTTAINAIPLVPDLLELVGLAYTAWFVWRYLLYEDSRAELLEEIDDFLGRAKSKSDTEVGKRSSKKEASSSSSTT